MKKTLGISLTLVISYFGIISSINAQTKRDIAGFYPGMNVSDFDTVLKRHNLSCGGTMISPNSCYSSCNKNVSAQQCLEYSVSNGMPNLRFGFTNFLPTKTLWMIDYYFYGVKQPSDMIDSISTTFNNHDPQTRWVPGQVRPIACGTLVNFMDRIALWNLGSLDSLILGGPFDVGHTIKGRTDIPGWSLTLCNDKIKADDLQANERDRENTLSPPTRF